MNDTPLSTIKKGFDEGLQLLNNKSCKRWEEYPPSDENEEDILSNGTFSRDEELITFNIK